MKIKTETKAETKTRTQPKLSLKLEGASKSFGAVQALAPLNLEVQPGEWLAVIGRNGSGKTSLLRLLVGLSRPTQGRVLLDDAVPGAAQWRAFCSRVGFMPERVSFQENLTGSQTLTYLARLRGVPVAQVLPALENVGLAAVAERKVGGYSKGMLQRLNLAQALLGDPDVLVLDEPTEGLDPAGVRRFVELARRVEGRTVVFSSHRLPRMEGALDRLCVLAGGHLKGLGREEELFAHLDRPARVVIQPAAGQVDDLRAALSASWEASLASQNGNLWISVRQADKLGLLAQLKGLEAHIQSVRVEEPSVEEALLEDD